MILFIDDEVVGIGAIDSYMTALWGGYSLTKLHSGYTGPAIRVRRSTDNAEQDIGFIASELDIMAMASFVGSNSGYVSCWYDQSGGGNNITNATAAAQPLIMDAGVYTGEVLFDGVNDQLLSANTTSTTDKITFIYAGRNRLGLTQDNETQLFLYTGGTPYAMTSTIRDTTNFSTHGIGIRTQSTAGAGYNYYAENASSDTSVYAVVHNGSSSTIANNATIYINGTAQSRTQSGTGVATALGGRNLCVGGSTSSWARCAFKTLLLYTDEVSSGDVAAISTAIRPTAQTLGLDAFTSGLKSVYSLRKQLTAYAGSCLRVRRSSDNTEQDIGFVAGLLDTASLLAFAGAGSAYVVTWYDQSINSFNFTQSTAANQPRIVASGSMDLGVTFDGSDDVMITGSTGSTPTAVTVFVKARTSSSTGQCILEHNTENGTLAAVALLIEGGVRRVECGLTSPGSAYANYIRRYSNANAVGNVIALVLNRSAGTINDKVRQFSGGRQESTTFQNFGTSSATFANAPWRLGRFGAYGSSFIGWMESVIIYESAVNDADVERISRVVG